MENKLTNPNQTVFEQIKEVDGNGNEFWGARKISKILDYAEFRNFIPVIERAKESCRNSGQDPLHHFVDYHEEKLNRLTMPFFRITVTWACMVD